MLGKSAGREVKLDGQCVYREIMYRSLKYEEVYLRIYDSVG